MKIVGTAIIADEEGRILIGQRPEGKDLAGLWEFPGGKQETGETIEECIVREIKEELGVCCHVGEYLTSVSKVYPHGEFKLMFYRAELEDTENLKSLVHQELRWVHPDDFGQYEFPPADVAIIEYLQRKA